jgi:short-subunit dehydrogenase involved in D-alanine esterification of teichoic acids
MEKYNEPDLQALTGDDIKQILKSSSIKKNINESYLQTSMMNNDQTSMMNNDQTSNAEPMMDIININTNLRTNIKLSLAILKKLNNFDHNYIHELFNTKTSEESE